jgi:c-di-GMP-binding flagellar brake protein YcgR
MNKIRKKDRRKFIRLTAYHLAKYKVLSFHGEQVLPSFAVIRDIGAGGACLRTEERLLESATIELKINFPSVSTPLCTLAKVIWASRIGKSRRYEIGVEFIGIEESIRKIIDGHIKLVYQRMKKKMFLAKGGKDEHAV